MEQSSSEFEKITIILCTEYRKRTYIDGTELFFEKIRFGLAMKRTV